jgi:hypothetical protein
MRAFALACFYAHPMFWAPYTIIGDGGDEHSVELAKAGRLAADRSHRLGLGQFRFGSVPVEDRLHRCRVAKADQWGSSHVRVRHELVNNAAVLMAAVGPTVP